LFFPFFFFSFPLLARLSSLGAAAGLWSFGPCAWGEPSPTGPPIPPPDLLSRSPSRRSAGWTASRRAGWALSARASSLIFCYESASFFHHVPTPFRPKTSCKVIFFSLFFCPLPVLVTFLRRGPLQIPRVIALSFFPPLGSFLTSPVSRDGRRELLSLSFPDRCRRSLSPRAIAPLESWFQLAAGAISFFLRS